jgi:cytochrome c biogenesis protein CcdA
MILFVLAYLGGVLTIVSPCILPVLPFVFARADRPFVSSGLPLLAGMAATFALVATLAAVGGGWVVAANDYGRLAALALLALFGVTLLFPSLSDRMTQQGQLVGDGRTTRSRGRCAGRGPRNGFARVNGGTVVFSAAASAAASASAAVVSSSSSCISS